MQRTTEFAYEDQHSHDLRFIYGSLCVLYDTNIENINQQEYQYFVNGLIRYMEMMFNDKKENKDG